jgi:hypothetical protein
MPIRHYISQCFGRMCLNIGELRIKECFGAIPGLHPDSRQLVKQQYLRQPSF